jgi:tetratricopeptide (TPR) repeat protein
VIAAAPTGRLLRAALLATLVALPAAAQEPEGPRHRERRPHLVSPAPATAVQQRSGERAAVADPDVERLSRLLSSTLADEFRSAQERADGARFDCRHAPRGAAHLRALRTLGRFDECAALAETCRQTPAAGEAVFEGARCAAAADQFERAYALYDLATRPDQAGAADFQGRVYRFARFAFYTQYPDQAAAIVARNPAWTPELILGVIEYLVEGFTRRAPVAAVEAEVMRWTREADPTLRQAGVVGWAGHLSGNLYRSREALQFLEANLSGLTSPEEWYPWVYWSLYRQRKPDFERARLPYEAALEFLHADSWLPVSQSIYSYSQLAATICTDRVLQGPALRDQEAIKSAWLSGASTPDDALAQAQRLDRASPRRADLLTFMGSLAESLGRDEQALAYYWRAHLACSYYSRAHAGLVGLGDRRYYGAFADHDTLRLRAEATARATVFPSALSVFVANWASLPPEGRERFKYAVRVWANHIASLAASGARVYVKPAFQRLSEVPGYESLRDARVDGPGFEEDNRLWDDIGGVADGRLAVFEYDAILETPFGAYNVAAHEVAHLFHAKAPPAVGNCITALYRGAAARNVFPDPYAAINEAEYFAQGVGYYITPLDAPPRFGLTVRWLMENDPGLYELYRQIEATSDVSRIACPVSAAP